ncbi:MAG: DUF4276 family protein [Saprospiraceae bacterium]|nr:DUF4276 family protein [Saprospiraceae bacterium]
MVKSDKYIYLEGGGNAKDLMLRCEKAFRLLLEKAGFRGRMPRLVASGGRNQAFSDFKTAHANAKNRYVAMLIDSEEPFDPNRESPWQHLSIRDQWEQPDGAVDEQVLFMATCMETWVIADRPTLRKHYRGRLQENALPPMNNLENRPRQEVQQQLETATRSCTNAYQKGKRSFEVLGQLDPEELERHLPNFRRIAAILNRQL